MIANETTIHQQMKGMYAIIGNRTTTRKPHIVGYKRPRHEKYETIQLRNTNVLIYN